MKLVLSLAAALALAAPGAALACEGHGGGLTTVSVQDSAKMSKEKSAVFVDANGAETRAKQGVIPGAILLTSYSEFDATKELPANKEQKLIFYCANDRCGASKAAAGRAMDAGYVNVSVLPEGIAGWKAAGLATTAINKAAKPARNS